MTQRYCINRFLRWSVIPLGIAILSVATLQPVTQAQPPGDTNNNGVPDEQEGTTVLTRGPIHEAFGQPTVFNPKQGLLIPKKPPQPVEELPPDEKPEGDNVAWLGGYWSWDEEKNDFMWISGFWRVLPPGRQWIPGYWNENAMHYQWVSGYWAGTEDEQQEVIAQAPPDTLEQGAPPTAPSDDHIWAPGTWVYRESRYMWRPGYWIVNQPGWAWIPSTYYWTPSGYVYVDGFWDWSIRRRGILFAPCYMNAAIVYRPGYYYRPRVCLDIDLITPHFFCRPTYGHYYFGDYYASSYVSVGITPWFNVSIGSGPRFYSSDFSYYACHYRRTNPNWVMQCRTNYDHYRTNVALRPARTYVNQVKVINNININKQTNVNVTNMALAKPMKTYTAAMAKNADAPMKIERINDAKVRDFGKTAADIRKVAAERSRIDGANRIGGGAVAGKTGNSSNTASVNRKVTLPKSPIVSKVASNAGSDSRAGSKVNVGSIGGKPSKGPPPIPGGSGIKSRVPGNTGVIGSTGGAGNAKTGSMGSTGGATGNTKSGGIIGNTKSGGVSSGGIIGNTKSGGSDTTGKTSGSSAGNTKSGAGTIGSGGSSKTGASSGKTGGTIGGSTSGSKAGSSGSGAGSGSRLPPVKSDPPRGSGSGGVIGSGSKSSGSSSGSTGSSSKSGGSSSGTGSKSGSSSSGSKRDKDK